jgi:hypothetical protein
MNKQTYKTADMPLPKERKIITRYEYPPIPWRSFDWVAFREGDEETGPFYWGATEQDAITELKEYEVEE